jgi:hypothetical protein
MKIINFNWEKKGRLFLLKKKGWSHSSHPCINKINESLYEIYFASRDIKQRSHIFKIRFRINNGKFTKIGQAQKVLSPGKLGYFDNEGCIPVNIVKKKKSTYLIYVGWQNFKNNLWICDTGLAKIQNNGLNRMYEGPIVGRSKNNPLFTALTSVIKEKGYYHAICNIGIYWKKKNKSLSPKYGLHYAKSKNLVNWSINKKIILPFKKGEYAFGRPSIIKMNNFYYMWYAHRATKASKLYRIGMSISKNLVKWKRFDSFSGITVSKGGWDSKMICYPCVTKIRNKYFMLYNGNGYGKTGFGLAEMLTNDSKKV